MKRTCLHQLLVALLEHEGLEPGHQPLDPGNADGKLFSRSQAVVILFVLFQPVELVRSRDVLDQRLEQVLGQDLGVATKNAAPEFLVGDVLQGSAQQDGQVLRGLRVQDLQLLRLLFAWNGIKGFKLPRS